MFEEVRVKKVFYYLGNEGVKVGGGYVYSVIKIYLMVMIIFIISIYWDIDLFLKYRMKC